MLRGKRKMRLSRAALETLAIIAYKQPVTKSEVEAIRGVDSSGTLATLLERSLVTIKGRSTVVGRPLLYGSTPEFLNYFGLKDLAELPRPEELRALVAAREPEQLEMMELDGEGLPLSLIAGDDASRAGRVLVAGETPTGDDEPSAGRQVGTDLATASDADVNGDEEDADEFDEDDEDEDEDGEEDEDADEFDEDDEDGDDDEDEDETEDETDESGRPTATFSKRDGR